LLSPILSLRSFCSSTSLGGLRSPPSFPTRRSSDLLTGARGEDPHGRGGEAGAGERVHPGRFRRERAGTARRSRRSGRRSPSRLRDRKSTRLNSSHVSISYAVFSLKKKTNQRLTAID